MGKYYSIDKIHHMCGEACMPSKDFLNYNEYKETETHGFGPIKMTVDLYAKPTKSVALPPITPKSVAGVIAGLLDGFVEENRLTEIEACYDGAKPLEADLAKALADAKAKNIPAAIEDLMAVAAAFPAELAS